MNDPFDALRITDTPLDPRPEFAAALRSALATQLENDMTQTETQTEDMQEQNATTRPAAQTITAYLSVRNAAAALTFYVEAFDAVEQSRRRGQQLVQIDAAGGDVAARQVQPGG